MDTTPARLSMWWEDKIRAGAVKQLRQLDIHSHKTSDTVFLLGTGESVNNLTPDQLKTIERHDSIGINTWPVHPLVPTFYGCEGSDVSGKLYGVWRQREEAYREVPIIVFDCNIDWAFDFKRLPPGMASRMHVAQTFFIPGDGKTVGSYEKSLREMFAQGFFKPSRFIQTTTRRRASGIFYLCLAIQMGYKKIVLVGFDMQGDKHFHQLFGPGSTSVYVEEDSAKGVPVSQLIGAVVSCVADQMGVEVLVASKDSRLYPRMKLWEE